MPDTKPTGRPSGAPEAAAAPGGGYPLERLDERRLARGYRGPVFLWDIDKTYLDTRFSRLKDILSIAVEFAIDKRAFPGTVELLRGIRRGRSGRDLHPIYFVSASPRQMMRVLAKKMTLDGVEYDGITLKDVGALARQRRLAEIRNQVAFKLCALLAQRRSGPARPREFLFGDDAESDAEIYSLYARIASGEARGEKLRAELAGLATPERGIEAVLATANGLPAAQAVERIYIHLVRGTAPSSYGRFGDRLLACPTPLTMALDLHAAGLVAIDTVADVARALRAAGHTEATLLEEGRALGRRTGGRIGKTVARAITGARDASRRTR